MPSAVSLTAAAALLAVGSSFHLAEKLPPHARGGQLYQKLLQSQAEELSSLRVNLGLPSGWAPNATANSKPSFIDNFQRTKFGTFQQRFWWDTSFCGDKCWDPATPVVCEVSGEWTVVSSASGAVAELAQKLGAVACNLEHRYYGSSTITPLSNLTALTTWLRVEQSIEDFANFVPYFEAFLANKGASLPALGPNTTYTPGYKPSRKWTIAGGSYAGALVSWITVKHGDLLAATWASSGVVNAIYNYTAFDQTIATAVGPDCANALRAVTSAFEAAWAANQTQLFALYNVSAGFFTQQDFAWMLADSAAMGPQYGYKDLLCSYLNSTAQATPQSPVPANAGGFPTGWAALQAFARWTADHYGANFGQSCYYSTPCLSAQAGTYAANLSDSTTWVWQCCGQLAYWQIAPPQGAIRSQLLTSSYYLDQCRAAYGPSTFPDTVAFNAMYGGAAPKVNGSRVFATQGSDDPWQPAGAGPAAVSATYKELTAVCDGCSHCRDLHASNATTDPAALTAQREAVIAQITTWVQDGSSNPSGPLSAGAIAGIVIAGVLLIALVGYCGRRAHHSRRMRRDQAATAGFYTHTGNGYAQVASS
jgi:hypothetical protein